MVRLIAIPKEPNPNNPFGKDVLDALGKRLMELKYKTDSFSKAIKDMSCKNMDDKNYDNTITINDNDNMVSLDCCCDEFRDELKSWLTMGQE